MPITLVFYMVYVSVTNMLCSFALGLNIHNTIAMSFLDTMSTNIINKELLRYLAKAALSLEISDDPILRKDLKVGLDKLLEVTFLTHLNTILLNMYWFYSLIKLNREQ